MKHRRHFYFLSALVLTVLSGLLIDGPIYVLTVFLSQLFLACIITVVRHRKIDQWFYDHVESTYFLISIFVGISLLYLSTVPFFVQSWLSNVQLLLFFILPGALLATTLTWYAARHMHHQVLGVQDKVKIVQVSILCMLIVFAMHMIMIDTMVPEPWGLYDHDETMLLLNQEGVQDTRFMRDVAEIFERERMVPIVDKAAYDPLCVFSDCLNARIAWYKQASRIDGLHWFARGALQTVHDVDYLIESSNLSTVHANSVNGFVELKKASSFSFWQGMFDQYAQANSFVLRGYQKLVRNSQYGTYLFQLRTYDGVYDYKQMMVLNVNESQLSQAYRYTFLSGDIY